MNRKNLNLLFLVFIALSIFFSISVYAQPAQYPQFDVYPELRLKKLMDSNPEELNNFHYKVVPAIQKKALFMWKKFDSDGEKKLPSCVFDAFKRNVRSKSSITITFCLGSAKSLLSIPGDEATSSVAGVYSKKRRTLALSGIYIYGKWKSSTDSCYEALLFHELLHYCFDIDNKNEFNVRDIDNPKKTDNANLYQDEGIVEDCELLLFPCGGGAYKTMEKAWYPEGGRRYNIDKEECLACKLCKNNK